MLSCGRLGRQLFLVVGRSFKGYCPVVGNGGIREADGIFECCQNPDRKRTASTESATRC